MFFTTLSQMAWSMSQIHITHAVGLTTLSLFLGLSASVKKSPWQNT
jgi:hypothetical protein